MARTIRRRPGENRRILARSPSPGTLKRRKAQRCAPLSLSAWVADSSAVCSTAAAVEGQSSDLETREMASTGGDSAPLQITRTILRLPQEVLEDIIAMALDFGPREQKTQPVHTWEPGAKANEEGGIYAYKTPPSRKVSQSALPLLLSCKTLGAITITVIFSRVLFSSPNDRRTDWLLTSLGRGNQLHRLRHVGITLYSNNDDNHEDKKPWRHNDYNERVVEKGAALLRRLPEDLLTLVLEAPYHQYPCYATEARTHPALLGALKRLPNLRNVDLNFYAHWLHISKFCGAHRVPREWDLDPTTGNPVDQFPPPPMFPNLRYLYLNGCLGEDTSPVDLILAFSQQQLPSLQSLIVDGLLFDNTNSQSRIAFVPEVFRHMNRLTEFSWVQYDFETNLRRTLGEPHEPPTSQHLDSLREYHSETLQLLHLNYTGWDGPGDNIYAEQDMTKEYVEEFIKGMPMLKNIYIDMPISDIEIRVGKATIKEDF